MLILCNSPDPGKAGIAQDISVVGDLFEGLNAVKKQQLVYAVINEHIASGTIHAVNMKTLTRAEAASLQ